MIIQGTIQTYVFNQTGGVVTDPINGSYLQAYCEFLGVTEPVNGSWLQALCNYFGITTPLYSSWTIALANYYGITQPLNATWWYALSQLGGGPPVVPIVADFTADNELPTEGEFVQFTDTSTENPTSWSWTFAGGTPSTSTAQNPLIEYNTAGTYTVSLTASKTGSADTNTKVDFIDVSEVAVIWNQNSNNWNDEIRKWAVPVAPVANFTSDTTTPNSAQNVQFTDTSTNMPTSWAWTFAGGIPATSTLQNPIVSFETIGGHTVSLQVTNLAGTDTKTVTDYINVNPVVADFTSDATIIFENSSINYTDTSTGAPNTWLWTLPGATPSTSTLQNPTIAYNTPGTYTVTLEASNAGSTDTEIKTNYITVNVIPIVADFNASSTTPNEGDSVTFTDTSTANPTAWSWTLPGGTPSTSTAQNPLIAYNTAGTYTVSLTASKTGSADTETKTNYITVVLVPSNLVIDSWEVGPFINNLNGKSTTQFSVSPFSNNLIKY
jgi:PKD repeat protein